MSKQIILKSSMYLPEGTTISYRFQEAIYYHNSPFSDEGEYGEYAEASKEFPGKYPEPTEFNTDLYPSSGSNYGYGVQILILDHELNINDTLIISDKILFNEEDPWRSIFSYNGDIRKGELQVHIPYISDSELVQSKYESIGLIVPPGNFAETYVVNINLYVLKDKDIVYGYLPLTYMESNLNHIDSTNYQNWFTPEFILAAHYSKSPIYLGSWSDNGGGLRYETSRILVKESKTVKGSYNPFGHYQIHFYSPYSRRTGICSVVDNYQTSYYGDLFTK